MRATAARPRSVRQLRASLAALTERGCVSGTFNFRVINCVRSCPSGSASARPSHSPRLLISRLTLKLCENDIFIVMLRWLKFELDERNSCGPAAVMSAARVVAACRLACRSLARGYQDFHTRYRATTEQRENEATSRAAQRAPRLEQSQWSKEKKIFIRIIIYFYLLLLLLLIIDIITTVSRTGLRDAQPPRRKG